MLNKRNLPFPDINLSVMALSSPIHPQLHFSLLLLPLNSSLEEKKEEEKKGGDGLRSPSHFNYLYF